MERPAVSHRPRPVDLADVPPVPISPTPVEIPDAIAFDRDRENAAYDADQVRRFWRSLVEAQRVFELFGSEPAGFQDAQGLPAGAGYDEGLGEFVLPYDAVREAADPDSALLGFLQVPYEAAPMRPDGSGGCSSGRGTCSAFPEHAGSRAATVEPCCTE